MKLTQDERNAIVDYRLKKAKETLDEIKDIAALGYWRTAANRLYYACYYAVSALLVKHGYSTHTHSGVINLFGLHFVSNGIVSREQGKFYGKLFELRQTGDYSDLISIEADDVQSMLVPAKEFIALLEKLILTDEA